MMLASIVGPVGALGWSAGGQKTFPVAPRHALTVNKMNGIEIVSVNISPSILCGQTIRKKDLYDTV